MDEEQRHWQCHWLPDMTNSFISRTLIDTAHIQVLENIYDYLVKLCGVYYAQN
jgi:hypothetical protein